MTVSVVILTCQLQISLIRRALNSVLAQTRQPDNVIIIEAGQRYENDIDKLVKKCGKEYVRNISTHAFNVSRARNFAAKYCNTDYICFMDGDDEWYPNMLESHLALMEEGADIVTSKYYVERYVEPPKEPELPLPLNPDLFYDSDAAIKLLRQRGDRIPNRYKHHEDTSNTVLDLFEPRIPEKGSLYGTNHIGCASFVMLRKSVFSESDGFDQLLLFKQEWDLWIRLVKKGCTVAVSDEICGIKHDPPFALHNRRFECTVGWRAFIKKHGRNLRRYPLDGLVLYEQYKADMVRFGEKHRHIFGPVGIIQRRFSRHLPWWMHKYHLVSDEDWGRLASREEMAEIVARLKNKDAPVEEDDEDKNKPKPWFIIWN